MRIFAGWLNRHQQDVVEYLQEEIGGPLRRSAEFRHTTPFLDATLVSSEADGAAGLTADDPAYHAAPNRSRLVTSVIGLRRGLPSLLAG